MLGVFKEKTGGLHQSTILSGCHPTMVWIPKRFFLRVSRDYYLLEMSVFGWRRNRAETMLKAR